MAKTDATRAAAAAKGSLPTAKRGRLSERMWADVRRAARIAREEGVTLRVHHGGVDITGVLKQQAKAPRPLVHKAQKKPVEAAEPILPSTTADETSPPTLSKRKQRSTQRLLEFQEKKRAALFAAGGHHGSGTLRRAEAYFQRHGRHPWLARAKLRWLLWRAWAQYRPIFGGAVLKYTSLREQHVYRRAAKLYAAAFSLDPGKSGRPLAAWLRHATPMEIAHGDGRGIRD